MGSAGARSCFGQPSRSANKPAPRCGRADPHRFANTAPLFPKPHSRLPPSLAPHPDRRGWGCRPLRLSREGLPGPARSPPESARPPPAGGGGSRGAGGSPGEGAGEASSALQKSSFAKLSEGICWDFFLVRASFTFVFLLFSVTFTFFFPSPPRPSPGGQPSA